MKLIFILLGSIMVASGVMSEVRTPLLFTKLFIVVAITIATSVVPYCEAEVPIVQQKFSEDMHGDTQERPRTEYRHQLCDDAPRIQWTTPDKPAGGMTEPVDSLGLDYPSSERIRSQRTRRRPEAEDSNGA
ncbi:hypothetical protein CF319_g5976 [Tilletia indica]|nr:hypothetical protein CF319_g5976 [Tilletia indica]